MAVGIIGGSGLYSLDGFIVHEKREVVTPWGEASSPLILGTFESIPESDVVFLARHGEQHQLPPHKVNYRANIAALRDHQVSAIYAVNVVGGINREMCPGDLVIPDQIIDYTWGREHTYSDGIDADIQHIDFTFPYDQTLRGNLLQQAIALGYQVHSGGVYGATQGPRLETAAEIIRMEGDGCDIVGMTGMPEAALARELGIPYVCLALVVNMAAGLGEEEITMEQIGTVIGSGMVKVRQLLARVVQDTSTGSIT